MKSSKKVSILSLLVILSSLASCNGNLPGSTASPIAPNSTISPTTPKPTPSSTVTKEEFNITTDVDDGATISGLPEKASEGDEVEFQVELKEEKEVSYVTIDGENIITPENGVYKFVMPAHAVTVKAVTQDMRYTVNVEQVAGATIAVSSTLAKKGETIKVRIAITDSTKKSPMVKAGDIDVPMALVENETKTFEGSFVEPGSEVSLSVTLSDAPAEYAILDKAGDGAVVVNAPKTAKAGDKVTFSMALDSGFEFAGKVKVTAGDTEVEVIANDDGTYSFVMPASSVTISQETTASIYKINATIGEHLEVDVPDYAAYNSKVEFVVPSTNEYEVDKVTLDNVELVANEEGKYSFTMKDRAVSLVVTEKERFAPVILNNSKHLMMTAYTHDEETNTYTPVTQVRWGEKLYIKVTPKAGVNEGDYGIDKVEVKLGENDTRALYTNSDGYYYNPSAVVSDMTYGLQFTLTEVEPIFDANHVIVGSHAGAYINYSYSSGVSLAKTKSNLVADRFGNISFPSSYSTTTTKITSVDDTTKTFKMESSDYEGGWTDNGLIYILSTSTYSSLEYDLVFLQGSTSSNLETEYLADSKDSTPTKYIARLKNDTKDIYVYAEKTGSKKATISEITSIQVANGLTSFTDEGAIFKATINGEDKYFINRNGLLTDYSTTNPLTLTGSLGTITTDGICNATVTKGDNTINTTYSMDGESLTIIIDGKKHTLKVDTTTNTYQELKFSAGLYIGGKVSSSHSYYKMQLTTDFKGKWESGSNSTITFNDDQTFTFSSYKVLLSDNKDLALVRNSSNTYLLSKDITEYSSDSVGMEIVGLTNGTLKTGEKFVADIYDANTSSSSLVKKAVYFDGSNYVFGSIKNNTAIDTKGISFIFVTEDNHEISMKNNNSALEIAIDVSGTYTDTDTENNHGELILSNDGTGTLNNVAITYEVTSKDVITVKEGNTTYTISLANSTYTITNTEVLALPAFAGQTFQGKIDYYYDDGYDDASLETYDAYIKFSSSEKTLSFSAGDGASASNVEGGEYLNNKNVEYTYDETSKEITVALKYNNGAHTVVFVYDSTKNTLTPKSQVTFEGSESLYIRKDPEFAFTKVA